MPVTASPWPSLVTAPWRMAEPTVTSAMSRTRSGVP